MSIVNTLNSYANLSGQQEALAKGLCKLINSGEGATRQLLKEESSAVCLFDRAAGIVYTLPSDAAIGSYFDFRTVTTITSNAAKVITGAATQFLVGAVIGGSDNVAEGGDMFTANGTTHVAISSNGTTTGGIVGDAYRITRISSTQWLIAGLISGTGTLATPFATS